MYGLQRPTKQSQWDISTGILTRTVISKMKSLRCAPLCRSWHSAQSSVRTRRFSDTQANAAMRKATSMKRELAGLQLGINAEVEGVK
jgi:hypothetical protein